MLQYIASYNSLKSMEKRQSNWYHFLLFRFYVHRYLRLTMVYAFVIFFRHLIVHLSDGPLSMKLSSGPDNQTYKNCDAYWWTNLIYISNLYPWRMRDGCMLWTWSLANDMQFYVISPLIWIPLYYSLRKGLALSGVLLSTMLLLQLQARTVSLQLVNFNLLSLVVKNRLTISILSHTVALLPTWLVCYLAISCTPESRYPFMDIKILYAMAQCGVWQHAYSHPLYLDSMVHGMGIR